MSVINKVLRDLERRNASLGAGSNAGPVRAVPSRMPSRRTLVLAGVCAVGLAGALFAVAGMWPSRAVTASAETPAAAQVAGTLPKPDAIWGEPVGGGASAPAGPHRPTPVPAATVAAAPVPETLLPDAAPPVKAGNSSDGAVTGGAPGAVPSPTDRAEIAFADGRAALTAGRTREAEALWTEALQLSPWHVPARKALVDLLVETGRLDLAEGTALAGLQNDAQHVPFAVVAARLQSDRGDLGLAIATLDMFEQAGARHAEYLALHAALLQRTGRHAEAVQKYSAAIALGDPRPVWFMGRAISLRESGRTAEARAAFRQALETGALSPDVRAYLVRQINLLSGAG